MLLKIFRSQSPIQFFLTVPLLLGLWFHALGEGVIQPSGNFDSGLYRSLVNLISLAPATAPVIALLIVILETVILNYLLIKNNLSLRNNLLPAFIFILLTGSTHSLTQLSAPLVASLFLLLALVELIDMYNLKDPFKECFNAAFFVAAASLVYFPAISFFLMIWVSLLIYRIISWREWIITIIGFLAACMLAWLYFFWTDQLMVTWNQISLFFTSPENFQVHFDKTGYLIWGVVASILLISLSNLMNHINEKVIAIRRKYWMIIFMLVIGCLSFFYANQEFRSHLIFLAVPATVIINYGMLYRKKPLRSEIMLWLMIFAIIASKIIGY